LFEHSAGLCGVAVIEQNARRPLIIRALGPFWAFHGNLTSPGPRISDGRNWRKNQAVVD
jgi:hypothetical protein